MTDPDDRFDMPDSAFKAARENHGMFSYVSVEERVPSDHPIRTGGRHSG